MNTKSLQEQVKEVLESNKTRAEKVQSLIKLGVTPYESNALVRATMRVGRTSRQFTYTFGVEIEAINCPFASFKRAAEAEGLSVFDQFYYNHNDMAMFKLTTDSSVHGDHAAECVTPPLRSTDGFYDLAKCCRALRTVGARANSTCGLHVHIGAAGLTNSEYCNVFVNYMYLETAISSFLAPSRRSRYSRWCKSLLTHEAEVLNATTKDDMRRALGSDRYHRVNANAYAAHKTIEFRQHQGTTNYTKIAAWVKFLGKLVEYSKTNRLTSPIDRIEDIPFLDEREKSFFLARKASFAA